MSQSRCGQVKAIAGEIRRPRFSGATSQRRGARPRKEAERLGLLEAEDCQTGSGSRGPCMMLPACLTRRAIGEVSTARTAGIAPTSFTKNSYR